MRVGIIGIGHGTFGRRSDATVQELAFEAFRDALADAGIDRSAVDASVIGSVPEYHKQRSLAGVVQEYLGLNPKPTGLPKSPAPRAAPRSEPRGSPSARGSTASSPSSVARR